jgi:predicted ATPase
MGLHTGEGRLRQSSSSDERDDYVGIDVNYTARIAAAANGGQVVVSAALLNALDPALEHSLAVTIVDEGLRAVKDFEEPSRLHRVVAAGASDDDRRLRTVDPPSNLPGDVTALVGRDDDIDRLAEALRSSRIVTLTGPGGSGKTRLALGVARSLVDRFPHGTWFVDLAALRDPGLLVAAIASTIGARESSELPVDEVLRQYLRERSLLLVVDNLEQLLPDAADIVAGLVRAAPDLRLLVTSRELMRIGGERGYPVPPLGVDAGAALFEDRALAHRPDLVLNDDTRVAIMGISVRLAGLPLAIELAAARVRTLSPAAILDRLERAIDLGGGSRDLPERQRTLRGAITWSHDLLNDPERRLFRRLAVFAGGWTAAAAAAVTDADGDLGLDLTDGLESLADKSLVRIEPADGAMGHGDDEVRFGIHPLLREYAYEQLTDRGERAELERRHARVMAEIGASAGEAILGSSGDVAMHALDREADNLRIAGRWFLDHDEPAGGLRLVGATWRWFQQRGRLREGRALIAELLAHPAADDAHVRIAGLTGAGGLAYWMDDIAAARAAYEERLDLSVETGDPGLIADAHYDLGFLSMIGQDVQQLRAHEQQAFDQYRAAGREEDAIRARQALVLAVFLDEDYALARELQGQNLEVWRELSPAEYADGVTLLAGINYRLDDLPAAWDRMLEGLRIFSDKGLESGLVRSLGMASIIRFGSGDAELAVRIAAALYSLMRRENLMLAPVKVLHLPDPAALAAEAFGPAAAEERLGAGASAPVADIVAEILAAPPLVASGAPAAGAVT